MLEQVTGPIASVTADGAYDGEPVYRAVAERQPDPPVAVVVPPRATAVPGPAVDTAPSQRDRHLQLIRDRGRMGWQRAVGYGRRSLGETAVFRYKAIIGRSLRARPLPAQKTEARVACSVLNRMARLGMPVSRRTARTTATGAAPRPSSDLCTKALNRASPRPSVPRMRRLPPHRKDSRLDSVRDSFSAALLLCTVSFASAAEGDPAGSTGIAAAFG